MVANKKKSEMKTNKNTKPKKETTKASTSKTNKVLDTKTETAKKSEVVVRKKILQGVVVSTKSKKTAVVKVERKSKHSFYKKTITSHKKYHVHDEKELTTDGNLVRIIACRPISALKKWRLLEIIK